MKKENAKNQKAKLTELVFILDRSGSMEGLVDDTIGGFNSLINKNKELDDRCIVSTVLFDDITEVIHDRVDIKKINKLTRKEYYTRGCTALVDAIGLGIHHIGNVHKYARPEDRPDKTMFVIITDGMENASHIYTREKLMNMIRRQEEKYGWEFLFIGANIDAVETAKVYGIREERAVNYHADKIGTDVVYRNLACATVNIRSNNEVGDNWRKEIDDDFKGRKAQK